MTFLPNKPAKSMLSARRSQAGVTLLLATLVLSAIAAISFSLAAITFVEIQVSNDLSKTEPALYAVTALAEQAVFQVKRAVPAITQGQNTPGFVNFGSCAGTSCPTVNLGVINSVSLTAYGLSTLSANYDMTDVVKTTSSTVLATKNIYSLYDASSPYAGTTGYSQVIVTYVSGGTNVDAYVCDSSQDCVNNGWTFGRFSLNAGNASHTFNLDSAKAYQMYLVNTSSPQKDVVVDIKSFGPNNSQKGLPYFGKQSVQVSAGFQGLTRKYQIFIPNQ